MNWRGWIVAEGLASTWEGYDDFLRGLKSRIRQAQIRATASVNHELILLYWRIGKDLVARQESTRAGLALHPDRYERSG